MFDDMLVTGEQAVWAPAQASPSFLSSGLAAACLLLARLAVADELLQAHSLGSKRLLNCKTIASKKAGSATRFVLLRALLW